MPNVVTVTVENAADLLNDGAYGAGAVARVQTATTETGIYADLTGTGSTPTLALVSGTRLYQGYDPAGTSSSWYRVRYENVGATRASDWTAAFQVGGEAGGLICSLYDVKQRLESNGATLSNTEQEQVLEYIGQVTSYIQGYTGRRFVRSPASGTTTYLFDVARSGRELSIPAGIATASTLEVATGSQPETSGTYATVTAGQWFLRPVVAERSYGWPATQIVISDTSGSYFAAGYNTVRVTMALGWDKVPSDIAGIASSLVMAAFRERASSGGDTMTIGIDGERRYERSLSYRDRQTLDWYRVIP